MPLALESIIWIEVNNLIYNTWTVNQPCEITKIISHVFLSPPGLQMIPHLKSQEAGIVASENNLKQVQILPNGFSIQLPKNTYLKC